jgi:hypothetical protein
MIEVLQANAQPIALPEDWGILAYTWSHGEDVVDQADCPVLEARRHRGFRQERLLRLWARYRPLRVA